jgi:hypothetical protein
MKGHHLYNHRGTWNKGLLASSHCHWEAPTCSLLHTNKGTNWREEEHNWYLQKCSFSVEKHVYQNMLSIKKLKHFADISFRELLLESEWMFTK